jgi:A/G-specific adenine glycosylase
MIHQREQQDIWKGLYEFPLIESDQALDRADILNLLKTKGVEIAPKDLTLLDERKQTLSHRVIKAKFFKLELKKHNYHLVFKQGVEIKRNQLSQLAFPVIIREFLGQTKVQSKFLF